MSSVEMSYPIVITERGIREEDHQPFVSCDQVRLEQYLSTVLNYSEVDAVRLSQSLARRLEGGRDIDDFWQKALLPLFRKNTTEIVDVLLKSIEPHRLPSLLRHQDKYGQTALAKFAFKDRHDIIELMLDSLKSKEECFKLLIIKTKTSWRTPLHVSCWRGDTRSAKTILDHVTPDQRYELMKMQTINGNIPLHCAAYFGVTDMLEVLHASLTNSQWNNLMFTVDRYGLTILQKAVYGGNTSVVNVLKGTVNEDTFMRLVSTKLPPWDRVKYICELDRYQECQKKWTLAWIEEAINRSDDQDKADQIQKLIETEPLTVEHIKKLSPHSPKYVIPYNQQRSKRYGLIMLNSHNRPHAAKEASYFEQLLKIAEFNVFKIQWSHSKDLHEELEKALTHLTADCSLLLVCLMAHGSRGELAGSTGAPIPINNVLKHLTKRLSMTLPVLVVVQACQSTPHVQDQASIRTIDHQRIQHIELLRPNTVLFLASVRGGLALRGAFTGAVADVLLTADGATDISAMFDNAAGMILRNKDCKSIHQLPELRKTTSKRLILPPTSGQGMNEYHQSLSTSSLVPQAQTRWRMYALILYCTAGRVGAIEEADALRQSLEVIGGEVWMMEWYDSSELELMLESSLQKIAEAGNCSMLIVSFMCHGGEGNLIGASGHEVTVNSVLQLLSSSLDPSLILVTLIQACQVMSSSDGSDEGGEFDPIAVQASDPDYDKHITLLRPNSVLLMATTRGGKAKRGAFVKSIADELKAMDGAQDICTIFDLAVGKMLKDRHCMKIGQCPELRKTPCKSQIISRAES